MLPKIRNSFYNILILCLTFGAVIFLLLALLTPRPAQPAVAPANAETAQAQYTARAVGNRVVIYRPGKSDPAMITQIDIRTLPDADQAALAEGIELADATALAHLLEDYDG